MHVRSNLISNPTPHPQPAHVLVLQHLHEDGPGYLAQWLCQRGVSWHLYCTEAGHHYPETLQGYRALAVLGGAWSANDDRPSLRHAEALIRQADALGLPVLGHCLGGQLMARAFGGQVARNPQPEIGWLPLQHHDSPASRHWLGHASASVVFQWHHDSFVQLPPGAELLASSGACAHQAFALRQHLAMQFHIEITPAKITDWLTHPGASYPRLQQNHPDSVQTPSQMQAATPQHLAASEALAEQIYGAWARGWG